MTRRASSRVVDDVATTASAALSAGLGKRLVAVVLFGSRARGDASPGSDWDLLVVANGLPEHPLERHRLIKSHLPPEIRAQVAVIAKTPAELEARLQALYLDIALDGEILFDRGDYAAIRLAMVQDIIERAGLRRERTPYGDIWQWRDPPRGEWSLEWDS